MSASTAEAAAELMAKYLAIRRHEIPRKVQDDDARISIHIYTSRATLSVVVLLIIIVTVDADSETIAMPMAPTCTLSRHYDNGVLTAGRDRAGLCLTQLVNAATNNH